MESTIKEEGLTIYAFELRVRGFSSRTAHARGGPSSHPIGKACYSLS